MSYDEAVEAAAEAIGGVLGFEYSRLQNKPMARAAINAALPHLRDGYDREAIARAIYRRHTGDSDPDAEPWFMHEDLADAVIEVLPPLLDGADAPTDPASGLEVPADDATAVGEPDEQVIEAVAQCLSGRFGSGWGSDPTIPKARYRNVARDLLAVARDAGWQPAPTIAPSVETIARALAWDEWDSLTVGEQSDCRDQAQAVVRADPRESVEDAERRGAVRALREAAAGAGLPDTLSRKYPKGRVRDWLLERARRIEREGQQ